MTSTSTSPDDRISSLKLPVDYVGAFAAFGEAAAFMNRYSIYLADLATGSVGKIGDSNGSYGLEGFAFDGEAAYWLKNTKQTTPDLVPCLRNGPITWQLFRLDVSTRQTQTLRSGVQKQDVDCGPLPVIFDVDADTLAVAHEADASPGWDIDLTSIANGALVRTIHTDLPVQSVSVSGGDVAFVVGTYKDVLSFGDPGGDYGPTPAFVDTKLMFSAASDGTSRALADDAYSVELDAGRLIWMKGLDENVRPVPGELMTSLVDPLSPIIVSDLRFPDYADDGALITWWGEGQNIWRASDQAAAQIGLSWDPSEIADGTVSDGWLTWHGGRTSVDSEIYGPDYLFGIPVADIPL